MYITSIKPESIDWAIKISKEQNDFFSIIHAYSEIQEEYVYFIERGTPLIRINEILIGEYEKGKKL